MLEVLIQGGEFSTALVPGLAKYRMWRGRAVTRTARNERWEYWAAQNVMSVHIPMEKIPNVPRII